MTKEEFLGAFGQKLSEGLPNVEVLLQMQYYQGYFDAEMRRGRSEADVLAELGDPVLLARNVLESPAAQTYSRSALSPYEQGFAEGSYVRKTNPYEEENRKSADPRPASAEFRESERKTGRGAAEAAAGKEAAVKTPDGKWRKEQDPENLRKKGTWQKMPDPKEEPELVHVSAGRIAKQGLMQNLVPMLLGVVLLVFIIVGVATGELTKNAVLLPIILLAAALVIVFILVKIRRKRK